MKRNAPQNCVCGHCKAIHRPRPKQLRVGNKRRAKFLCNFGDCRCTDYRPIRTAETTTQAAS